MKIFNIRQANFLLIEGCKATATGYGQKDGKVYIMFQVDEKCCCNQEPITHKIVKS